MTRLLLAILLMATLQLSCQNSVQLRQTSHHTLAFYNIENLFDTIDDPRTLDEEFLPGARVTWNSERYHQKLQNITRVIAALDTLDFPHIIGLAEVENKAVLMDLVAHPVVQQTGYEIIHVEDDDPRGIEVALLYRKDLFKPLISNVYEFQDSVPERHILYASLVNAQADTLHVFVNHWRSRRGGAEASEPIRIAAAQALRLAIHILKAGKPKAKIVVMGDFNDNPNDISIMQHLLALPKEAAMRNPDALVNLAAEPYSLGQGTLYFNNWDFFDQMMVSQNLMSSASLRVGSFEVIVKPWMLYSDNRGNQRPNRTMSGSRYFGGYSDHLPVLLRLERVRQQR